MCCRETIDQTYPHLSAALDGVARFSDTIGKRDEQIKQLLARPTRWPASSATAASRSTALLVNAQTLLAAFNERGRAISMLLSNVSAFSEQVRA